MRHPIRAHPAGSRTIGRVNLPPPRGPQLPAHSSWPLAGGAAGLLAAAAAALTAGAMLWPPLAAVATVTLAVALRTGADRHRQRLAGYLRRWRRAQPDPQLAEQLARFGCPLPVRMVPGPPNAFLLADGLLVTDQLADLQPAAIDAVLAHEAAHHLAGDHAWVAAAETPLEAVHATFQATTPARMLAGAVILSGAALPLLLLAGAAVSLRRQLEYRADAAAATLLGDTGPVIAAIDACPGLPRLTHPSAKRRAARLARRC